MYTLLELESKTFAALKQIGDELNVLPEGDRRYRESWINAIAGVNPPLLQLLETSQTDVQAQESPIIETVEASPAADDVQSQEPPIESKFGRIVYPRPAQGEIPQVAKTSPGVEVDRVSEAIKVQAQEPYPRNERRDCPRCVGIQSLYWTRNYGMEKWVIRCLYCDYERSKYPRFAHLEPPVYGPEEYPTYKEAIRQASAFQAAPPSYSEPGDYCCTWAPMAGHPTEPSPGETEATLSQSAIVPATETSPGVDCVYCNSPEYESLRDGSYRCYKCQPETDQNPNLTGIPLSDKFLARYSPPQPENIRFQSEDDGQLSLVNFEVVTEPEPPDPDDFESLDAFREAIALWDAQNPEPLDISLVSMCEWAPCPEEWYEPEPESLPLKASSITELSPPAIECSITSANFTIPTFGAWCDRANRQTDTDEPPDTGIFARGPKPKPPTFPPQAASWTQVNRKSTASQPKSTAALRRRGQQHPAGPIASGR